jgi:hypothetical protein
MEPKVVELTTIRDEIRRYRPWYDESVRTLAILRRITEAFPQDGAVSAKTIQLRAPATVTCTGTARNRVVLIKAFDQLRVAKEISGARIENTSGSTPLEFTINFQWVGPGAQ